MNSSRVIDAQILTTSSPYGHCFCFDFPIPYYQQEWQLVEMCARGF